MKKQSRPHAAGAETDGHDPLLEKYDLINQINDLICEVDEEGKVIFVNLKFKDVLGYSPDEVLGRYFYEFVHPDELVSIMSDFEKNLNSSSAIDVIYRFRHKDGNYLTLEFRGTVYTDRETNRKKIVSISRDLTEQRKAEEAKLATERKYRKLYESMMDGYVYVSMDGIIREFNITYQEMLGYTADEIIKLHYQDITPLKWHPLEKQIVEEQVLIKGYSEVYQKEYIRKDGTVFPVELRTYLIRDEELKPQGMWAIVRDITNRKKDEEQLTILNQKLNDSNLNKDKLLSILVHDLRSPMNSILGFSELLLEEQHAPGIDTMKDWAYRINSSARHTYYLLENLMAWSRTQAEKIEVCLQENRLKTILEQILSAFETSFAAKQITVITDDSIDIVLNTDLHMVRAILRNLISNALKFTKKSGTIQVFTKETRKIFEIVVRDNGVGLSDQQKETLFEHHEFKSTTGTSGETGSGLGLLICKEFVERLGGKLWVHSEVNIGSEFHFTIPKIPVKET